MLCTSYELLYVVIFDIRVYVVYMCTLFLGFFLSK